MYATRIPAISKYNVNTDAPDKIADEFKTKVPPSIRWKADNYNHLHEQVCVFVVWGWLLVEVGDGMVSDVRGVEMLIKVDTADAVLRRGAHAGAAREE